jgi:hypothetical protein
VGTRAPLNPPGVASSTAPRLLRGRALRGCNVHHDATVFVQGVDLGGLAGARTGDAGPDFAARFLDRFAGLERVAAEGRLRGAFLERLTGPTGVPFEEALLEAILAVELFAACVMRRLDAPDFAAIVPRAASPRVVDLVWACHAAGISRAGAAVALAGLVELLPAGSTAGSPDAPGDFAAQLARLRRRAVRGQWSTTAAVLAVAARERGIPCEPLAGAYLRLGDGATQQVFSSWAPQSGPRDGGAAPGPDPAGAIEIGDPARVAGTPHELLVIDGRVVSALRVEVPTIAGDGRRTVAQLVAGLNDDARRDGVRLRRVEIDEMLRAALAARGRRLDDVPGAGEPIPLDGVTTVERGAIHTDVTDEVHPETGEVAVRAVEARGLRVGGVDLVTPDIARSCREVGGQVTRVRSQPDLYRHAVPASGMLRDVGRAALDLIFPPGVSAVVPTALIVGERGTSSIARELDGLLRAAGRAVGLALRKRTTVSGKPVDPTSLGRRGAAKLLLRDPRVECLVSAASPRSIVARGLRLSRVTVTAIVDPDVDGDPEVYRRAIEVVLAATAGPVVIGATNPHVERVAEAVEPERRVMILPERELPARSHHLAAGAYVVVRTPRDGGESVELRRRSRIIASVPVAALRAGERDGGERRPRTLMYATALAFGLGLSGAEIATAAGRRRYLRR